MLARKQSQESLSRFIEYLELGYRFARHHELLISELEKVELGETPNLMVQMPPGSAKSTYASVLFPAWYLGKRPSDSVIAASHTLELAERFGRRVRNLVAGKEFGMIFGVGVAEDSQAAGRWDTDRGGEYFASGVGGSITGRRVDLGIIDDPVKSREDADSEVKRESTWQWYLNDFLTRLKPGARQVLIMTRWHEDDLAGRILAREGHLWRVIKIPMIAGDGDILGRAEGELLWPEWFTEEIVKRAKMDVRSWMALYQQEPRPMGGGEFQRKWIKFYHSPPKDVGGGQNKYILCDPAGEKKKDNDYTSIWVVGLGSDGNYYLLDCVRDRLNLTDRGQAIMRLHRKWKPIEVRYERYGMMADVQFIRDLQERDNYRFDVTEVAGTLKKEDRIRRLVPLFEQGKVYFPEGLHYTGSDGIPRDLITDFTEQELLAFPVGRHDDMLDSLSRIAEPDLTLVWPAIEEKEDRYSRKKRDYASPWAA